MINKLSAYKTYILFSGATSLFFSLVFTVSIVYQVEQIHLNPLQLILVGTTLETACFIFEIPTGIVADIYSRKLSVIIGLVLIGTGFILEGSIMKFSAVILSQVFWGIGYTFISGAIDAWIAGEDKTRELNKIYMRGAQISQAGSVIGIVASTLLGNLSLRLPIILGGSLFVCLAIFLSLFMPENNFTSSSPEELNTFGKMWHKLKISTGLIKSKPVIMLLLSVTFFIGLSSEGYDRLSTAHFLKDTVLPSLGKLGPVTWFGIFSVTGMLISSAALQIIIKISEKTNKLYKSGILLITNIFYILFMMIFALTGNFIVMLAAYLSVNMFRTINDPILIAWLNENIDDEARATVLSTNGQLNALGQILGGPAVGIIASKLSISSGIVCSALLLFPVPILFLLSALKDRKLE